MITAISIRIVDSVASVFQLDNTAGERGLTLDAYGQRGGLYSGDQAAWHRLRQECVDVLGGLACDGADRVPRAQLMQLIGEITSTTIRVPIPATASPDRPYADEDPPYNPGLTMKTMTLSFDYHTPHGSTHPVKAVVSLVSDGYEADGTHMTHVEVGEIDGPNLRGHLADALEEEILDRAVEAFEADEAQS